MTFLPALALVFAVLLSPAAAAFSTAALDRVGVDPKRDAALPLSLRFTDENRKSQTLGDALGPGPAVLIFADYTCHTLCGPILDFAAAGLEKSGLTAGADYRLIVIGLDQKDGIGSALAMKTAQLGANSALANAATFLTGDQTEIQAATSAVGYHYAYDAEHDQFAHPAAAFIINSTGQVTRVLSGVGLSGGDLRLALVDASAGRVGSFGDRLRLLCYGYDPVRGIYTETITLWLELGAVATLVCGAAGILFLNARARRRAPS